LLGRFANLRPSPLPAGGAIRSEHERARPGPTGGAVRGPLRGCSRAKRNARSAVAAPRGACLPRPCPFLASFWRQTTTIPVNETLNQSDRGKMDFPSAQNPPSILTYGSLCMGYRTALWNIEIIESRERDRPVKSRRSRVLTGRSSAGIRYLRVPKRSTVTRLSYCGFSRGREQVAPPRNAFAARATSAVSQIGDSGVR